MTNVYKWRCKSCGKVTFSPIPDEEVETFEIQERQERKPKIRIPKIKAVKAKEPKIRAPTIRIPKIKAQKTREPKTKKPKIKIPKIKEPKAKAPKVKEPKVKEPKIKEPKVKVPKIKELKVRDRSTNHYVIFNHQHKGEKYIKALEKQGKYEQLFEDDARHKYLAFVLADSDILGRTYRLDQFRRRGCEFFFVFPHTARPNLVNDIIPPWKYTTAQFVVSQGHVEVMQRYGYERPLYPVGWTMCPIRPFKPRSEPRNVLFAPIHPRCSKIDQKVNRETFNRLFKLAKSGDIILTVRFIRSLSESGIRQRKHPNVIYTAGCMDQGYEQIDNADVVVSHQTFAWIAVARGVPTVMMAEDMKTHIQLKDKGVQYARHWKDYVDLIAYPLDIMESRDTLALLRRAVRDDSEIVDWRKRMIGYSFRPDRFIKALESYL